MSDLKAKMHQNPFRLSLGNLQCSPDTPAGFKGPTSKGREGKGEGKGGEREKERRDGK